MSRLLACAFVVQCLAQPSHSQSRKAYLPDSESIPRFELYGLASAMRTVDATTTIVVNNPAPNQPLGFTPSGLASGARTGFVWRHDNVGLLADFGFHKYADHL